MIKIVLNENIQNELPDIAYHGAPFRNLFDILNKGIVPINISKQKNTHGLTHANTIFFTTSLNKAQQFSKKDGPTCVLEFKIPDKNKIISDFNFALTSSGEYYVPLPEKNQIYAKNIYNKDTMKKSKEAGMFGYIGRIPPTFIQAFIINGVRHPFSYEKYYKNLKASK